MQRIFGLWLALLSSFSVAESAEDKLLAVYAATALGAFTVATSLESSWPKHMLVLESLSTEDTILIKVQSNKAENVDDRAEMDASLLAVLCNKENNSVEQFAKRSGKLRFEYQLKNGKAVGETIGLYRILCKF